MIKITTSRDITEAPLIYRTLPSLYAIFTCDFRLMGYYRQGRQVMNSLLEAVMWGAPVVLLSLGLLLALGCVLVFRDDPSPREEPPRSGVAGARA